ncbi:CYTH domain-containing protein [Variovorax rhizosphaerae]|uniref:CYTH domain-containing protein n=1 Tax=Variovorax rhizosphaerae TaxID=1836200 RepID=A0ABU8WYR0_9BURK
MEVEFKFEVPAKQLKAVEKALRAVDATATRLQAHYFDTADGRLAAKGVALRIRKEGEKWVQTAKAKGGGPLHRLEHNAERECAKVWEAKRGGDLASNC